MVRRLLLAVGVLGALLGPFSIAATAHAQVPVSARDLVDRGEDFDGVTVTVEGELIGDYGLRSDASVWVQLDDDSYARVPVAEGGPLTGANVGIGVRLPPSIGVPSDSPGGYRHRGPLVRITGVWRHHDPARSGESYLDATSMIVVEPGRVLPDRATPWAIAAGLVALVLAAGVWRSYVRARERL